MASECGNDRATRPLETVKRRGLLRFGTLLTAITGVSAVSAVGATGASAAPGEKAPSTAYVPTTEKGAASGVATLDLNSKIPLGQLPNLAGTFAPLSHQASTTGTHGVGASTIESSAGAAAKVAAHSASPTAHPELRPASFVLPVINGIVNDVTVSTLGFTPVDGHTFIDSHHGMRYTRIGGAWYGEQITGATPFTPASVTSATLWAWFDASQLSGLKDNDPVAAWTDMSGNGRNATQSQNTAHRPLYKSDVLNGKPGLLFDGVQSRLRVVGNPGNPFTVFLVAQFSSAVGMASQYGFFDDRGHGARVIFDGVTFQGQGPSSGGSPVFTPNGIANDGTPKLFMAQFDGASNPGTTGYFARVNGNQGATLTATEGPAVSQLWLGAGNNPGSGLPAAVLKGYLFEVVIFSGRMSTADIAAMETYLS